MNLLPDFDSTATGYRWSDRLTRPWWRWRARRAEIRWWKHIARLHGDIHWTTARARSRRAMVDRIRQVER